MDKSTCLRPGCDRIRKTRGVCHAHYEDARRKGRLSDLPLPPRHPSHPRGTSRTHAERLARKGWDVTIAGCWESRGARTKDGYGTLASGGGKTMLAHRMSYEAHIGPIPVGEVVRHTCDNPPCINPAHLLTGIQADNVRDAMDRDRVARGENSGMHKLTDAECDEIRRLHAEGMKMADLSARFPQVRRTQVYRIAVGIQRQRPTNQGLAA